MDNNNTIRIPLVARMRFNDATDKYEIVPELSTYADIPADFFARFLMDRLHIPYRKIESEEVQP